jgi:hypothetical protein
LEREQIDSPRLFTRDMTEMEVDHAIRSAMPFPVISILHGVRGDKRHFAVNLRHPSKGVFNVNWHVPISASKELMMKSLEAARAYAVSAAERIEQ